MSIDKWHVDNKWYAVVPEVVEDTNLLAAVNKAEGETGGWTKDGTMKKIGSIPYSVLYNYAWSKGVPNHQHNDWYKDNNGQHMKELLNELPDFRVGDKKLKTKRGNK